MLFCAVLHCGVLSDTLLCCAVLCHAERSVGAAYLLDPVDELQPAAVDELAGKSLAVGVTAAGVTGAFNPSRSNFRVSCHPTRATLHVACSSPPAPCHH